MLRHIHFELSVGCRDTPPTEDIEVQQGLRLNRVSGQNVEFRPLYHSGFRVRD